MLTLAVLARAPRMFLIRIMRIFFFGLLPMPGRRFLTQRTFRGLFFINAEDMVRPCHWKEVATRVCHSRRKKSNRARKHDSDLTRVYVLLANYLIKCYEEVMGKSESGESPSQHSSDLRRTLPKTVLKLPRQRHCWQSALIRTCDRDSNPSRISTPSHDHGPMQISIIE